MPLIVSLEQDIRLIFASLAPPRSTVALLFSTNRVSQAFLQSCEFFFAWQFQVRLQMKPMFLMKPFGKINLGRFKLASLRRKNCKLFVGYLGCFVSKCRVKLEGFIDKH